MGSQSSNSLRIISINTQNNRPFSQNTAQQQFQNDTLRYDPRTGQLRLTQENRQFQQCSHKCNCKYITRTEECKKSCQNCKTWELCISGLCCKTCVQNKASFLRTLQTWNERTESRSASQINMLQDSNNRMINQNQNQYAVESQMIDENEENSNSSRSNSTIFDTIADSLKNFFRYPFTNQIIFSNVSEKQRRVQIKNYKEATVGKDGKLFYKCACKQGNCSTTSCGCIKNQLKCSTQCDCRHDCSNMNQEFFNNQHSNSFQPKGSDSSSNPGGQNVNQSMQFEPPNLQEYTK